MCIGMLRSQGELGNISVSSNNPLWFRCSWAGDLEVMGQGLLLPFPELLSSFGSLGQQPGCCKTPKEPKGSSVGQVPAMGLHPKAVFYGGKPPEVARDITLYVSAWCVSTPLPPAWEVWEYKGNVTVPIV